MSEAPRPHPIGELCAARSVPLCDLARATGHSEMYVSLVLDGEIAPSDRFKRACSDYLGRPESELFLHDDPWRTYERDRWIRPDPDPWDTQGSEA